LQTKPSYHLAVCLFVSCLLALPTEIPAAPQAGGQRAGEVSRVIPSVSIGRGAKTITASPKSVVEWQDTINTQASARARVGLDDGSVLNVGSDSSMRVIKHDAAAQETQLEVTYGKLRTQAQKISKPDGKFEVRTPAGVAGVVGTDFYVDYLNGVMNVEVFEGLVQVCNLAGQCVMVKAGQMTSVRKGDNSAPPAPVQAPLSLLTSAATDTDSSGRLALVASTAPHIAKSTLIVIGVLSAIPVVVVPIVVSHSSGTQTKPPSCSSADPSRPQPHCN